MRNSLSGSARCLMFGNRILSNDIVSAIRKYGLHDNHSLAYSMLSYLCGYLRYYYPTEFCTSFLNCAKNDADITNGTMLAQSRGCKIETPLFRFSTSDYGCDSENKIIYKGIGSIKDVGTKCGDNLYKLKDNTYSDFVDLLYDIKENKLANKTEMDRLIKIDFFKEFGDINLLLKTYDIFNVLSKRSTFKVSELEEYNLKRQDVELLSEKSSEKQFRGVDMKGLIKLIHKNIQYDDTTTIEHMAYELGILGYTNYKDSNIDENIYIVSAIEENKYGTKFVTLYQPNSDTYIQLKADRKNFESHPCDEGDIIKAVLRTKNRRKRQELEDGSVEWITSEEKENVLKDYVILKKIK